MGYYTNYEVTFENIEDNLKETARQELINSCPELTSAIIDDKGEQELKELIVKYNKVYLRAKWYGCETELAKFTEKITEARVTVRAHGEDIGDEWVAYAKAGQVEVYPAVLPMSTLW
jgi:hypothetical protein